MVDQRLSGRVDIAKNVGGDLDEIRGELARVPVGEDRGDLFGRHAERGRITSYASAMSCMSPYSMPL